GVAINPGTPTAALGAISLDVDYAVVMSVNPGWGGQPFLASSVAKVRRLGEELRASGSRASIEVDGGVEVRNAGELFSAGAEILVAGTAIYGQKDVKGAIERLRQATKGVRV